MVRDILWRTKTQRQIFRQRKKTLFLARKVQQNRSGTKETFKPSTIIEKVSQAVQWHVPEISLFHGKFTNIDTDS